MSQSLYDIIYAIYSHAVVHYTYNDIVACNLGNVCKHSNAGNLGNAGKHSNAGNLVNTVMLVI